jgi:hypothetical protein
VGKKPKIGTAVDAGSSSEVESEDVDSDEDLEIPPKTTIQQPNSALQMFCNSNMDKYSSKHPKLTKQELARLMAKEFAKLSEEKKKVYGNMAQKSKNEMSATSKKLKSKISKASETSKKTVKPTSATLKSPERSSDSPSKRSAANADSKSAKSPSKIKPSLNANVKSSTEKVVSKTLKSPTLAANQLLFKAEKMTEPLKPPA